MYLLGRTSSLGGSGGVGRAQAALDQGEAFTDSLEGSPFPKVPLKGSLYGSFLLYSVLEGSMGSRVFRSLWFRVVG